jgi:cobalt-zinc-cadmium efflux system outer membrane protein
MHPDFKKQRSEAPLTRITRIDTNLSINLERRGQPWLKNVRRVGCVSVVLLAVLLAGCAHFEPKPISPEQTADAFDARSLTNEDLRAFLATNQVPVPGPREGWDLKALTLTAFYYQPALAEARMQLLTAQAARITAGERPNPSVSVTPAYDNQIPGNYSPWIVPLTFDVPIETAGKRGKRMASAEHQAEAARWDLAGTVWQVRSQVRTALLNIYAARETESLLAKQEMAQSNVVRLLQGQLEAGRVSDFEVSQARTGLATAQLADQDAAGKSAQACVELARALGLPARALNGVKLSFAGLKEFPRDLTRPSVRRAALLNRADVRSALASYAASQSDLQLEIANQYPDLHLGPGYAWNNGNAGDNQWELGLTVTLPLLNQNQGGVAEAEAKRTQAAAHFLTVQANAVADIDSALAGYRAALQQVATAKLLLGSSQKQLDSVRAQEQAGETDPLAVANAEVEYVTGAQARLNALVQAQQALGQLEAAVQSPLTLNPNFLTRDEHR